MAEEIISKMLRVTLLFLTVFTRTERNPKNILKTFFRIIERSKESKNIHE